MGTSLVRIDRGAVSGRRGVIASALEGTPTDDNDVVSYIQLVLCLRLPCSTAVTNKHNNTSIMTDQEDGAYPRINGAMLQSQQYAGMLVSAVGKVTGHNTLLAADGVSISLDTDSIAEALMVNPGVAVEIIGIAHDATTIQVRDSSSLL